MPTDRYAPHDVNRADRADGTILLTARAPMPKAVDRTTDWLDMWALRTPDAVFLAERSGDGWREVTYREARDTARALAPGLLEAGLGPDRPLMIISGNSVDHGLLALAAQYVGVPVVPVAEQYALIPEARGQLDHVAGVTNPGMIFGEDGDKLADALGRDAFGDAVRVVSRGAGRKLEDLTRTGGDASGAMAGVGPDTVAKILMTSGSTSAPKGVRTTQRMVCANQAQIAACLPFLTQKPPRIVDWLPWNHVFGGSHNFNLMLANGGALYIDDGKPVPHLAPRTIENQRLKTGTIAFNVPVGFAQIRDAMREDADLRRRYFEDLDMLFYAGASLPQDVWADLEAMARDVRGDMPLFTSSWGLTETAPAVLLQHQPTDRSGVVGVPVPGSAVKLIPDDDGRMEIRVKGPNIFTGYLNDPAKTAEAFDEEGYFRTGDAMAWVDPDDANMGLRFDGRIAEEFKLLTGTWVRAAGLRLEVLGTLSNWAADVVVTGADRTEIGLLIVPNARVRDLSDEDNGALTCPEADAIADALAARGGTSSTRITRALILSEPPSIADGEITAKGNLNFAKIQSRRAALLDRLYDDKDPATIKVPHS